MRDVSTDELVAMIRERGAVVYGTGFVAGMLQEALAAHGLWDTVARCVVSNPTPGSAFHGVPVVGPEGISGDDEGPVIVVAVHEAVLPEVADVLSSLGAEGWVWAYPHLYPLLYGEPVDHRRIPVRDLVRAQGADSLWLAVRELVLDQPGLGREVYLKAQGLHCSPKTAERRLESFLRLARSFDERGFDGGHPLLVDGDLNVIDGLHRLVLAWHHGLYDVPCDVVVPSSSFGRLIGADNRMTAEALGRAGLSPAELDAVTGEQARLFSNDPLVSIVMPAFDVEGFLDQCMETVVAQTMPDFEAILVNDGSNDGTLARCREWEARDPRIRVVDKPNGGVSSARNAGMDVARGTWLAFVDPDDWLEPTYLERLLAEVARTGADRVECDLWRFDSRTGRETRRSCGGRMGVPFTREEQMRLGPTASYKAITLRDVWERNGVRFPDCPYESPAVYALVVALARKLAYVPEPLYHYRRFRQNSLVETAYASNGGSQAKPLGVEAMEELVRGFATRGLMDRYGDVLPGVVTYRLSDMLAMYHHRMGADAFDELVAAYRDVVTRLVGEGHQRPYLVLGGYNLNRILLDLDLLQDPRCRFNFSSVIALADEPLAREASHPNRYRELMLGRELSRDLWRALGELRPSWLFWDLVEERHDMGELDGRFVTLSDAFGGSSLSGCELRRIPRASEECRELWERSADAFLARVRAVSPQTRVVVVEAHLAERVGSLAGTRPFDHAEAIRATNETLDGYHAYLRARHPELAFVDARDVPHHFCDEHHEYGVVPEHLNAIANGHIAQFVREVLQ